jgi:hypothetical protein
MDPDGSRLNIWFLTHSSAPERRAWLGFAQHIVSESQYRTVSNLAAMAIDPVLVRCWGPLATDRPPDRSPAAYGGKRLHVDGGETL